MTLVSERPPSTTVPRVDGPPRRRRGRLALAVLMLVGAVALLGPLFAPHAVTDAVDIPYAPGSAEVPLGTDRLGSDVLSRVLSGGRSLLLTSLAVTAAVCVLGALLGMLAAWRRGWTDTLILRLADVLLGLPAFLLLSVVVVATGRGTAGVALASGLVLLPESVRVVRAATLRILAQDYVEVAVARGERTVSVLGREVLPNLLPVLAADAGVRFLGAVTVVATAAFLGYGAQPPAADWGLMVLENRDGLTLQPLAVLVPAALLLVLLLSVNLLLDAAFPGPQPITARRRLGPAADVETPATPGSLLSVRGLRVESDSGHRVLEDVDLDLAPGELLAVVGESGSGKTTLVLAALGHVGPGCDRRAVTYGSTAAACCGWASGGFGRCAPRCADTSRRTRAPHWHPTFASMPRSRRCCGPAGYRRSSGRNGPSGRCGSRDSTGRRRSSIAGRTSCRAASGSGSRWRWPCP
ncbi:hypothetical protein STAFG_1586 [Streptomyces afghaniensis 772]|uniref:ABC transmembrane type-1 domain-containing protein n=1 Tax=Streptomyces afghaniensis 772 TaxID=1283301 RepID=S4MP82_9ACTN|nr:hypothetical protein STAFG_1586 [Streptomyces afghaniensis 772]